MQLAVNVVLFGVPIYTDRVENLLFLDRKAERKSIYRRKIRWNENTVLCGTIISGIFQALF